MTEQAAVVPYDPQVPDKPKELHPWDMQPGETVRSYAAFLDYRDMGSGRKLSTLHKHYTNITESSKKPSARAAADLPREPPTMSYQVIREWSMTHKWNDRVAAWEQWEAGRSADLWAQRRADLREADWEDGALMRESAREIVADMPHHKEVRRQVKKGKRQMIVGQDGKTYEVQLEPDKEIIVLALNADTALRAVKAGSELQHSAAGADEAAERLTIQGTVTYERIPKADLVAIREALMTRAREVGKEKNEPEPG